MNFDLNDHTRKLVFLNILLTVILLLFAGYLWNAQENLRTEKQSIREERISIAQEKWNNITAINNERRVMCSQNIEKIFKENKTINGFYNQNEYYCVWTKRRNQTEIQKTDYHENCHALASKDFGHFCGRECNATKKLK